MAMLVVLVILILLVLPMILAAFYFRVARCEGGL